jgi:LuxR family transcriptional regulator, activator of conjugal transfer of Ti plasmids
MLEHTKLSRTFCSSGMGHRVERDRYSGNSLKGILMKTSSEAIVDGGGGSLWSFIRALECADSRNWRTQTESLRNEFATAAAGLGVRYFSYQIVQSSSIGPSIDFGTLMVTTNPDGWIQHYADEGYVDDDPILARAINGDSPIEWSQVALAHNLTERQHGFFKEARERGLGESLTLPIHVQHGVVALSVTPRSGAFRAVQRATDILYLMTSFFHQKIYHSLVETATVTSTRRSSVLTDRETQILESTAQGKSTKNMSSELGISIKSVDFHVENAKRKLQVCNRTHAVAKAINLGLIKFK